MIVRQVLTIDQQQQRAIKHHASAVIWFTGLSGAGKSTLANALFEALYALNCHAYVLDGDNIRHGLCSDLGFSLADRKENLRRVAEVAKLMTDAGLIVIASFISPLAADRQMVRMINHDATFVEVYCDANLAVCEARDVKGLYNKARSGLIAEFTGISAPYEIPSHPELVLNTATASIEECVKQVVEFLLKNNVLAI